MKVYKIISLLVSTVLALSACNMPKAQPTQAVAATAPAAFAAPAAASTAPAAFAAPAATAPSGFAAPADTASAGNPTAASGAAANPTGCVKGTPFCFMGYTAEGKKQLADKWRGDIALSESAGGCGVTFPTSSGLTFKDWWSYWLERPAVDARRPSAEKLADGAYQLRDAYKCITTGGKKDCSATEKVYDFRPFKAELCGYAKTGLPNGVPSLTVTPTATSGN